MRDRDTFARYRLAPEDTWAPGQVFHGKHIVMPKRAVQQCHDIQAQENKGEKDKSAGGDCATACRIRGAPDAVEGGQFPFSVLDR